MNNQLGLDLDELARVATGLDDEAKRQAAQAEGERRARETMMARLDNGEPVVVWMYGELKKRGMQHDEILLELVNRI